MKKLIVSLALVIGLFALFGVSKAEAKYVSGYFRSNGTYVSGYNRAPANALKYDNRNYNGGSLFNKSYTAPTRNYSPSWKTPKYWWQN